MLSDDAMYRAVSGRDARFDGVFFIAVTSTGIYCRPSCLAVTPKRENVRFYRSAAEAQAHGFRTCRRCRPDTTPGSPDWNVRADLVGRAMRLIGDGIVDREGVAGLASRLDYSERHLNRALVDELGASPVRLARAQRAHTARVLLETTDLPVTDVAFSAGFASVRQFNDTIRAIYAMTPRDVRGRSTHGVSTAGDVNLRLAYRRPADLNGVLRFLGERAIPGVEEVDGDTYRRSVLLPHGAGVIELTPGQKGVDARLRLADPRDLTTAVARCRKAFDLDADPIAIDETLGLDPVLGPWVAAHPGKRVPGTVDPHELAIRAVLGQQVSVAAARGVAARIVGDHGKPLDTPVGGVTHAFPTVDALAAADPATFPMPRSRQRTIHELAIRLADGRVVLDPGVDRDDVTAALHDIPGIGPWTTSYIRMRGLNDPDEFLPTDLIVKRMVDPAAAEAWRPWRSYALIHIWAASNDKEQR